jgi:hypothetical protein
MILAALAPACLLAGLSGALAQTPNINQTGIEVLARAPVHDAFAQTPDAPPMPGPVVPKQPPPPVPEEPPEFQPQGTNTQWIGGYWAWDADKNDYIWISGVYRDPPDGRKFVPGYWEQTSDGWRWVSGFWAPGDQQELPYVPQPPASLDNGPTVPPPGQDYSYVPGYWMFKEARFVWRPGYYAQCQPGFVWIRPHYVWTPGGCIFVSGYWDYPPDCCGLLFAPVYFSQPLWTTPGWRWRPHYVIGHGPLLNAFFIDTRLGAYRFGDYYGTAYQQRGIQPWHTYGAKRFDPLYGYYRWQNKNNNGWANGLAQLYDGRLSGKLARPAITLGQQTALLQKGNVQGANNLTFVQPVTQINNNSLKVAKISVAQVTQQKTFAQQQQNLSVVRKQTDAVYVKGPTLKVGQTGPPRTLNLSGTTKHGGVPGPPTTNKSPPVTPMDKKVIHDTKPSGSVLPKPQVVHPTTTGTNVTTTRQVHVNQVSTSRQVSVSNTRTTQRTPVHTASSSKNHRR